MSALGGAAAAVGGGFLSSLGQLFASAWILLPVAVAVLMLIGRWYLRRRITPFPKEEVGDDAIAMVRERRAPTPSAVREPFLADGVTEAIERMLRGGTPVTTDLDAGGCPRGCPDGECYCAEPTWAEMNGICGGCGAFDGECYCGEE